MKSSTAVALVLLVSQFAVAATKWPCRLDTENLTWEQSVRLRSTINNPDEAAAIEITYPAGIERVDIAIVSEGHGNMNVTVSDPQDREFAKGLVARARPFHLFHEVPGPSRLTVTVANKTILPNKFQITVKGHKTALMEPVAPAVLLIESGQGRMQQSYTLRADQGAAKGVALVRIGTKARRTNVEISIETDAKEPVRVKLVGQDGKLIGSGKCLDKEPFALVWKPARPAGADVVATSSEKRSTLSVAVSWRAVE